MRRGEFASSRRSRFGVAVIFLGVASTLSACKPHADSPAQGDARALPAEGSLSALPLGDLAGTAKLLAVNEVVNPLEGNAAAIAQGHRLFISMNCAGCHGYDAKGNMGPNLTDAYWRYGGTPSAIYNSIYEGRPQGMPAWGRAIPAHDIWEIVAYLQALGGTVAANEYHAGLQGDHGLTSTAAEAQGLDANPTAAPAPLRQPP